LRGAIDDIDGIGDEVVKTESSLAVCEHAVDEFGVAEGNTSHFHVVDELVLDRVGEGALDVKKQSGGDLACPPGIFDSVCDYVHGICGAASGSTAELHGGEHVVSFG
jgi:hypothetical protein